MTLLLKKLETYIKKQDTDKVLLLEEEFNHLTETFANVEVVNSVDRFSDLYLELVNKETDETVESDLPYSFLDSQMNYFEKNIENYLYIESSAFEIISAESFMIEVDSVFSTYELILGLQLPKKKEKDIRNYINANLQEESASFQLLFNDKDGLWELNLPLDKINGFDKNMTLAESIKLAYLFLFNLGIALER